MATFLELTNELLSRVNEGLLTASSFASARSVQGTAKNCINAAIGEIMLSEKEWSFNFLQGSQTLTVGQEEYPLPVDCDSPDWESFRIRNDGTLATKTLPLELISRDDWYKYERPYDEDTGGLGRAVPRFVFMSNRNGVLSFGVTPSPDQAYVVDFDYYSNSQVLENYDDVCRIPDKYRHVVIAGALKHLNMNKDNSQQGAFWTADFDRQLSRMRRFLAPSKDNLRDTRVNFGGSRWKGSPSQGTF